MATQHFRSKKARFTALALALALGTTTAAHAVSSSELFRTAAHTYGRFEARVQFAFGDGVVSSFFLWKVGSELENTFWNELDFEKLWSDCRLETNALYGNPEMSHSAGFESDKDLCGRYHTYAYEWTPDYIAWFVDGEEIRRESGDVAAAFRDNAAGGMRIHFNVWPGDESFGGNFDPAILPVRQYINWAQYSSYSNGTFQLEWREDFASGTMPAGWTTANWPSPKNLSTHAAANVQFIDGYAVLSLTADDAAGTATEAPVDDETAEPPPVGTDGAAGQGGTPSVPSGEAGSGNSQGQAGAGGAGGSMGIGGAAGAGGMGGPPEPTVSAPAEIPPPTPMASAVPSTEVPSTEGPSTAVAPTVVPTAAPTAVAPTAVTPSTGPSTAGPQPTVAPSGSAPPTEPAGELDMAARDDGGCGFRITTGGTARSSAWLVALGAIVYLRRQRRRASTTRLLYSSRTSRSGH